MTYKIIGTECCSKTKTGNSLIPITNLKTPYHCAFVINPPHPLQKEENKTKKPQLFMSEFLDT